MTLLTAHRILIGVAVLFFCFYGYWELSRGNGSAGTPAGVRGGAALLGAAVLGIYFLTLWKRNNHGDRDGGR